MEIVSFDIGWRNLAFCRIEYDPSRPAAHRLLDWVIYDAGPKVSGAAVCQRLLDDLLRVYDWGRVKKVWIETQFRSNLPAQLIAQTLRTFFTLREIEWRQISPAVKFRAAGLGKLSYRRRKNWTVERTREILAGDRSWEIPRHLADLFQKTAKRDDLADCLIQYLTGIEMNYHSGPSSEPSKEK